MERRGMGEIMSKKGKLALLMALTIAMTEGKDIFKMDREQIQNRCSRCSNTIYTPTRRCPACRAKIR